ncbi:MAG: hypothetical protein Q8J89_09220 [Caulobacter sp.]|nr:hypothetical protein [Caulobacter sp.]
MRAIAAASLTSVVVLVTMAVSAASSIGAATDGLTSDSMLAAADFGQTFSGGGRVPDDADAPIRTGRWDEAPAPVLALLGGPASDAPQAPTVVQPPLSRSTVQLAALTPPPSVEAQARGLAAGSPVIRSRVALASVSPKVLAGGPTLRVSVSTDRDATDTGSGLAIEGSAGSAFAPRPARPSQPFDAKQLLLSIAPEPADRAKGRWFVFAAGSGEAFGLNIIRDPVRGSWRRTGWSVERLAEFGKAQLGIGWRQGDRQVAVSAARREIGAYGYKQEDTVVGVTFTVSGKPIKAPKFEKGIPKAVTEAPPGR